ncbi:hypothetical protein C5167_025343 [Papaver somniferum]|uniref:Cation/H+ exchanger domain-containing protein n=1 Tax=Papaver somniferum TaxID=3469 RepID=A0A4Y7JR56_PAPSO|nr:hypothetical protein C5167_025343 [Papaver somniferum]
MDFAKKSIPQEAVDAFKGPLQDIVGLIMGNIGFVRKFLNMVSNRSLSSLTETGINCYALFLGLSFDVSILARFPREAIIAYTTIFSTFLVAVTAAPLLHLQTEATMKNEFSFVLAISLTLAGTSSPVLTRLLIEAKFAKSDVGQLVIGAASDAVVSKLAAEKKSTWKTNETTRSDTICANASFANLKKDKEDNNYIFVKFFFLHTIMLLAKVLGALACGILFKFHWHISIAIGLFLTVKGHLHIFIATFAVSKQR